MTTPDTSAIRQIVQDAPSAYRLAQAYLGVRPCTEPVADFKGDKDFYLACIRRFGEHFFQESCTRALVEYDRKKLHKEELQQAREQHEQTLRQLKQVQGRRQHHKSTLIDVPHGWDLDQSPLGWLVLKNGETRSLQVFNTAEGVQAFFNNLSNQKDSE